MRGMPDLAQDLSASFPPIPTTAAPTVVLWDSGPDASAGAAVGLKGLRPLDELRVVKRVAGSLKANQAWTLKLQCTLDAGATWIDVNAGTAVLANALGDFNVYVAGAGRRRLVAVFAVLPTTWLNSGDLRLIPQAAFVA